MGAKLSTPRFLVELPDADPFEVQAIGADLVRWDMTAAKHKWPSYDTAPFLWSTFLAWSAGRRTGQVSADVTFERFADVVVQVEALNVDAVGPTDAGPAPA